MRQTTNHLLMIRPVQFAFNQQTAGNNAFQSAGEGDVQSSALKEFDDFVTRLRETGIDVTVLDDTPEPHTPDSIFPNNWISFHDDGSIVLYPMFAENRRQERKPHVIEKLKEKFSIKNRFDLSEYEKKNIFLEGTGSMVLDRVHRIAYACLSARTDKTILGEFCKKQFFTAEAFTATDSKGFPIYHTNVMMCIADKYAIICLDAIPRPDEKEMVVKRLIKTNKEIIAITLDQMNHFAGNMLQVHNKSGKKFLIMSDQAFESLTATQIASIEKYNPIIHSRLDSIERNGGGSARCMMAEIFLPPLAGAAATH